VNATRMKPSRFIPRKGLKQYIPDQGWVTPGQNTDPSDTQLERFDGPVMDEVAPVSTEAIKDAAPSATPAPTRDSHLNDLHVVQRIADHQLVQARLRSEVSTLAQNRLATRLQHPPE